MQQAKQYRMNYDRKDNVVYLTEDRTQKLNHDARDGGYLDYDDFQARQLISGDFLGYAMLAVLAITAIAGIYVAYRSIVFLFTFQG